MLVPLRGRNGRTAALAIASRVRLLGSAGPLAWLGPVAKSDRSAESSARAHARVLRHGAGFPPIGGGRPTRQSLPEPPEHRVSHASRSSESCPTARHRVRFPKTAGLMVSLTILARVQIAGTFYFQNWRSSSCYRLVGSV